MKAHLKTTAWVLAALVIGGWIVNAHTGFRDTPRISCSSPEVIDTLKFFIFKLYGRQDDPSITNTGPLGTYGNQLTCSGQANNVVITYFIQPLDNGKFRVTGDNRPDIYFQNGPVNFLDEKKKLFEKQEDAKRSYEERLKKASSVLKNPENAKLCAAGGRNDHQGDSLDECIERWRQSEEKDLESKKVRDQKWANCVADAKKKGIPDYALQPNSGSSAYSNLIDCVGNYDPRLHGYLPSK
jgi:hypothetical protein